MQLLSKLQARSNKNNQSLLLSLSQLKSLNYPRSRLKLRRSRFLSLLQLPSNNQLLLQFKLLLKSQLHLEDSKVQQASHLSVLMWLHKAVLLKAPTFSLLNSNR